MAKSKTSTFDTEVVTANEAESTLSELRSQRGGRGPSKYHPIAETVEEKATKNKVVKVKVSKNEVGGLRGYLKRLFGEKYVVRSSKMDDKGEEYMAFIFQAD